MTIQTTSNLDDSIITRYLEVYLDAAKQRRVYDILGKPCPWDLAELMRGSSIRVPFLSAMTPATSAISEVYDVTPQILRDTYASLTPTSRIDALEWTENVTIQAFSDYGRARYHALGESAIESIDLLAQAAALQGSLVIRHAARASLDAGTAADFLTDAAMSKAEIMLMQLKSPPFMANGRPQWFAILPPEAFYDLRSGGLIDDIAMYQDKEIVLSNELGKYGAFKIISTPFAKVFGAAGADNASSSATTLASAASAQDKTIVVASATNISDGNMFTIGTEETADTHYAINERVRYVSESGTTITIVGQGANGGLKYDHASGVAVRNADSVYPVAYGGPASLAKVYSPEVGEFGEVVGPNKTGKAEQFGHIAYKYYGNYGRWAENYILRGEYASSIDA